MLPSGWHRTTVGESASFLTGFPFASAEFESNGVRLLRGSNVKRAVVDWNPEITQHWPRSDSALRMYELKAGDIVIAMDGALVGRSFARISERDLPAYLVQRVARLRGNIVDQSLLYAWITSSSFATHIDSLKTNSAIPHLSPHDIRGFAFISPSSTDEQRSIAAAIDDITDLIVSLERLIAKKQAMKQGMMQELLTGKSRLPGFDTPWRETTLGAVCRIKTGKRNNQDKNEGGRYPFYVRSATVERIDSYSYDCEAILVPGEGNIGSIFHYMDGKFEVHQRVYKISDFTDEVVGKFVFYFMRHFFGKHAMENSVKATVDSLRLPTFKSFLVAVPTRREEQNAIADVLDAADAEILALKRRLASLRNIKQGMMQELLTGRTRLKIVEAAA